MKTDTFTKVVLSIIATCLVLLALKNYDVIKTAQAGRGETINVNIQKLNGHFISNALPVVVVGN